MLVALLLEVQELALLLEVVQLLVLDLVLL
jgi:hypothetical protein